MAPLPDWWVFYTDMTRVLETLGYETSVTTTVEMVRVNKVTVSEGGHPGGSSHYRVGYKTELELFAEILDMYLEIERNRR